MASIESKLFHFFLRLINKKRFLQLQFAFGKFDFNNSNLPPRIVNRICNISIDKVKGRNVFTLSPKGGVSRRHVLYLHGGAYVQGFVKQHWKFLSMLVERTHCTIIAPDYPLAPASTFVDAYDMVSTLYMRVTKEAGPRNTILMGDSAGGGFALGLAQKMSREGHAQPEKIILLSPWLDLTLSNPEIPLIDPRDPFLDASALRKAGKAYAGNADLNNYLISPINGPIEGIGNISVFTGSHDILVADARKLRSLATAQGAPINYREYKDMVHVWMLLNFQESRQAREEIIRLID